MLRQIRRSAFKLFGTVAPGTAASWLERQMFTPSLFFTRDGGDEFQGDHIDVVYDSKRLAVWSWGKGPTVLLLHGWGGRASNLKHFVEPLVEAGFRVVAYDAPAHGKSDGLKTHLIECAGAVRAIGEHLGPVHGIVAHSFGAASAAMAVSSGLEVGGLVFIGAPRDIRELADGVAELLGLPKRVSYLMQRRVAERVGFSWDEIQTDRMLMNTSAPLLLFHDKEDKSVPWRHGETIARAVPDSDLVTTVGLGHIRITRDPGVVRKSVQFLRNRAEEN